jgi:hypothetical protein
VIALAVHDNLAAMSCKEPQQPSFDTQSRESSIFIPPEYEIFYGADHTLEWSPPAGSKELAFALSYHFPLGDLESKMQAATRRFIKAQKANASGDARNLDTGDGNKSVEQETSTAAADARLPQGEPRRLSATRSINNSEDLTKNSTNPARQHHHRRGSIPKLYFGVERSSSPHPSKLSTSRKTPPAVSQGLEIFLWNPEVQVVKKKIKKRRYEKEEAAQVTANRGYACEEHRRRRLKVSIRF